MEKSTESTEGKLKDALESSDDANETRETENLSDEPSKEHEEEHESIVGEIRTREGFNQAIEHHSELKLRKSYEKEEEDASAYFDSLERGEVVEKPAVVERVESLELRRVYESVHDGPPEVRIESMKNVDDFLEKYPEERARKGFDERYRRCEVYFEVKDEHSEKRDDLAEQHDVSHTFIGYCRNGIEPNLIKKLRGQEEERELEEWAKNSPQVEELRTNRECEPQEVVDRDEVVKRIETHKVRESVEKMWESGNLSSERVASAIEHMLQSEPVEKHPIQYADFKSEIDSKQSVELDSFIQSNRQEIEESVSRKLGLEHNRARVAFVDGKMYTWIPKNRSDELVSAYETEFYYFRNAKEVSRIINELQSQLELEDSSHKSLKHMNEVVRQFQAGDNGTPARKRPISEKSTRLEGKVIRFYLDATDRSLSDLEGRVTKVTGVNGQAGIENPRFPEGEELEVLKARLASIIASDGHLRESGRIGYNEEHLERIDCVQEILRNFGDITLKPKLRPGSYEVHIQNQIGLIMIHEGMTPGIKTIHNPGLPEGYLDWSEEARRAYLEELIPEDGSFSVSRGFSWSRSHALYVEAEKNSYGFKSVITTEEVKLVKDQGKSVTGLVEHNYLAFGGVEKLQTSEYQSQSKAAKNIVRAIWEYPNNLIEDEKKIAESLGMKITLSPNCVKFFPKSGRLTVNWSASTTRKEDAERWADICPPNDERKRNEVESWIRKRVEDWLDNKEWVDW